MKTDRQIADEVFGKIEKYERARKKRRRILAGAAGTLCAAVLLCLAALPVFLTGGGMRGNMADGNANMEAPGDEMSGDVDFPADEGSGAPAPEEPGSSGEGEMSGSGSDDSDSAGSDDSENPDDSEETAAEDGAGVPKG
ncbi:MAG TPA: hypothetical protein IAB32_03975 [Candidatus Scatosoma pullicola]|nr:hypothetical protein [Candidatus Scatosoma pullicola]